MDNFDLRKYLVENKATTNSKMLNETLFKTGREYLKATAKDYGIDLDSPDAGEKIKESGMSPADVMYWMAEHDPEVGSIDETELGEYLDENNLDYQVVAEYQYEEESYDFATNRGAGEYDSALEVGRAVTKDGKPVKIEGYDFTVQTDRGTLTGEVVLMNTPHVKILKSISDIFDVDTGWYAGYKDRTKN